MNEDELYSQSQQTEPTPKKRVRRERDTEEYKRFSDVRKNEPYNRMRVDAIKQLLEYRKGKPLDYEITVDSLPVVPKGSGIEDFDYYQHFVNNLTEVVRVRIYKANKHFDEFSFYLKTMPQPLSGVDDKPSYAEQIAHERQGWELQQAKEKIEELKEKLKESEEYINKLSDTALQKKNEISVEGLAGFAPVLNNVIDRFAPPKENQQQLSGADTKKESNQETEANFKRAEQAPNQKNALDKIFDHFGRSYSEAEMKKVYSILITFCNHKKAIHEVFDLLDEYRDEPEKKESKKEQENEEGNTNQ